MKNIKALICVSLVAFATSSIVMAAENVEFSAGRGRKLIKKSDLKPSRRLLRKDPVVKDECCNVAIASFKSKMDKLDEALAGKAKGTLGVSIKTPGCKLNAGFYAAWWGGADGWGYDTDGATDLLPKIQSEADTAFGKGKVKCEMQNANPEGVFSVDQPVVHCTFDEDCKGAVARVVSFPKSPRWSRGIDPKQFTPVRPSVLKINPIEPGCCDVAFADAKKNLEALNNALAPKSKGILGKELKVNGCVLNVHYYSAWWGGADGWGYDSDAAIDLLPAVQKQSNDMMKTNVDCKVATANPEGVFSKDETVVSCNYSVKCK